MPNNSDSNSEDQELVVIKLTGRKIKMPWRVLFGNIPKTEWVQSKKVMDILTVYEAAESFDKISQIKIRLLAFQELEGILKEMKEKLTC